MAITKLLAKQGHEVILLNRGSRNQELPEGVRTIQCDISDEAETAKKLEGMNFDCVGEFIGFVPAQAERDFRLFSGRTKQYIYISSASAYQKPLSDPVITESTPLSNPHWQYSRDKTSALSSSISSHRSFKV